MTRRQMEAHLVRPYQADTECLPTPSTTREFALLEELSYVRREAQAEANMAYEDWRVQGSATAYSVYRAAQDRADAAQDDLAKLTRQLLDYARRG